MSKIYVIGIGPGAYDQMTGKAIRAMNESDAIIGYTVYVDLVKEYFPGKEFMTTPMKKEVDRCVLAFEEAKKGKTVSMICSGDAGVYGMAGLMYEVGVNYPETELEIIPGVTAATGGAAVLGAPLIHDFCLISLSDLLTPWEKIEARLLAAAQADFVVCLYNPSSKKRHDYLQKACDLMMKYKSPDTICGTVSNIAREGEEAHVMTLKELRDTQVDMFTTVFIGNSQTKEINNKMVTPRGYNNKSEKSIIIFAGTTEGRHLADYASGLNIDTHIFVATEYGEMILKDDKSFDGNKCIIHLSLIHI